MDLVTRFKEKSTYFPIKELEHFLSHLVLSELEEKQCEDTRCNLGQHKDEVIILKEYSEGPIPVPAEPFYCELCRLSRADPFCVTVANLLSPVKLTTSNLPTDGTDPVQSIEKTFQLTRAHKDLLAKPEYDVQAWCILLNDKVSFRMQWPQYADLQVNGVPVRVIDRPGSQLLGANGRDDGPVITPCIRDGINKISLTGCDARVFCIGVRIVKRRTIQQILSLIPMESDGERFEDALARVRRCVGGGDATENADSDSDLEVVADSVPFKLRCPLFKYAGVRKITVIVIMAKYPALHISTCKKMSGSRMKVAARFKPCVHMGCFDLDVFVEMNQRSRKWQCPICLKNYSVEDIIIDPYFNRITSKMRTCGEDVTDIEVKPDGSWRVKPVNERRGVGDLAQWHFADGSLCMQTDKEAKPKSEVIKQIGDPYIIILSDSEEENEPIMSCGPTYIILSDSEEENEPSMSRSPTYKSNKSNTIPAQGISDPSLHPTDGNSAE